MVLCTIYYDKGAAGSSDTLASGSNQPTTAITGTLADILTTTLTLNETVDFTGVGNDGTDVLYFEGLTGERHLFRVTSFNPSVGAATTLTLAESADSAQTGQSWAIGGIRNDLEQHAANPDMGDMGSGWRYSLAVGTSPYSMTAGVTIPAVGSTTDGPGEIVATVAFTDHASAPSISWTDDASCFTLTTTTHLRLSGIQITNTTSTWVGARAISGVGSVNVDFENLRLVSPVGIYFSNSVYGSIRDCDIAASGGHGIEFAGGRPSCLVFNTFVHNCGQLGIRINGSTGLAGVVLFGNRVQGNAAGGIQDNVNRANQTNTIMNNVCDDNGGDGIELLGAATASHKVVITNNVLTRNTGYGINLATATSQALLLYADYNAFGLGTGWENGAGDLNNISAGANDVTLLDATDPYSDSASGDLRLDATNGAPAIGAGAGYSG